MQASIVGGLIVGLPGYVALGVTWFSGYTRRVRRGGEEQGRVQTVADQVTALDGKVETMAGDIAEIKGQLRINGTEIELPLEERNQPLRALVIHTRTEFLRHMADPTAR